MAARGKEDRMAALNKSRVTLAMCVDRQAEPWEREMGWGSWLDAKVTFVSC